MSFTFLVSNRCIALANSEATNVLHCSELIIFLKMQEGNI